MKGRSDRPSRLRRLSRRRPSPSMVVALIALFVAMGGTATALQGRNTVFSDDITNQEVKSADVRDNHIKSRDVRDGSLSGTDIQDGSLGHEDLGADSVRGPEIASDSVFGSDVADTSLTGADVANNTLTGADIHEGSLFVPAMGCQTGLVHGFARVKGTSGIPTGSYSTSSTHIDRLHNCSGGSVSVKKSSTAAGAYFVRFTGNPATIGVATATGESGSDLNAHLRKSDGSDPLGAPAGDFVLQLRDHSGTRMNGDAVILLP